MTPADNCPACGGDRGYDGHDGHMQHTPQCDGIIFYRFNEPPEEHERDAFSTDAGERCEPSRHVWMPGRRKPWE